MKAQIAKLVGVADLVLVGIVFAGNLLRGEASKALLFLVVFSAVLIPTGIGILRRRKWGRILAMIVGVLFVLCALGVALGPGEMSNKWKPLVMMLVFAAMQIMAWLWLDVGSSRSVPPQFPAAGGSVQKEPLRCSSCGVAVAVEEGDKFCHLCGAPLAAREAGGGGSK